MLKVQNELIGTMARLMADFDCQVFYCNNVSEAASFIVRLHGKLHKPASKHGRKQYAVWPPTTFALT